MNQSNTPPFYVGEEVEYVTGINMPKGTKVVVTDIWQKSCGCWSLTHNKKRSNISNGSNIVICGDCNIPATVNIPIGHETGWCATSFRRLQRPKPMTFLKLADIQEQEKEEILTLQ